MRDARAVPKAVYDRFRAAARQLEQERAEAAVLVEPLLRNTPRDDWPVLAELAELRTCGALERLSTILTNALTRDPHYALAVAELAVSVAEALAQAGLYQDVVAAQLRAHAWKDLGKALRFVGRHAESIDALERGDTAIGTFGALLHDRAIVRFNLAVTLQETERFEESLALLAESRDIFREHADTSRLVLCGLAEGVLLQRLRRYREAREAYLLLLVSTPDIETEGLAALHHAIGFCCIELGDFPEAEANLNRAIELHRQLGQPIQVLKGEVGQGRLLLRRGEPREAIGHLRRVRRELIRARLAEEAGICALEIVEAMLLLRRPAEAELLARQVISEFTVAGLSTRAITALGYLSEAITARKASPALVTHVREYVLSLRSDPEREFSMPPHRTTE